MSSVKLNKYFYLAILWGIVILVLTLTPGKSVPDYSLFDYDKLGHAGIFGIFSFFLVKGVTFPYRATYVSAIVLISALYGLAIEIAQHFIPDRGMEWYDALANVIGSILGVALFFLLKNRTK